MKNNKKKILLIVPSLVGGGAEWVLLNLLKYLDRTKFVPYLCLFEKKGEYLNQVPQDVIVYDLKKKSRFDFFKLIFKLAYKIYPGIKPDIVLSFLYYANFISVISKVISINKMPVVVSDHGIVSCSLRNVRFERIKKLFVKKLYLRANKIIAVSYGVKADLAKNFNISEHKIKVVHNSVDIFRVRRLSEEPVFNNRFQYNIPIIIACGRLTYIKNYPLLLNAFAKVVKEINAQLLILGQGEEKNNLEEFARNLEVEDKVIFLGFQQNPFKYISKAAVFVLSSLYEGFSNVIIEAMACGVPVVSTCCPCGPEEIITDGVNGLLVPVDDVNALAEAILRLLKDESLRRRLFEAGKRRAKDFRIEKMVTEYERMFEGVSR